MNTAMQDATSQHLFPNEDQARIGMQRARTEARMRQEARRRRAVHRAKITALVALALIAGTLGVKFFPSVLSARTSVPGFIQASASGVATPAAEKKGVLNPNFRASRLKSSHAILIDAKHGDELFSMAGGERVYPASLTKIMSAVIVLDNKPNLRDEVTLDGDIFEQAQAENASVSGFMPGERLKVEDLLYGMMLSSGADSTLGLARYTAGSERDFVDLMNKKAKALGMTGTHFTNASGLHDANHYTTPADVAKLFRYALKNETFRKVVTSSRYSIRSTNLRPSGITLFSTMFEELPDPTIKGGVILGGKTGYTSEAGLCLASLAEKNGVEYILVTTGAPGNHKSRPWHVIDAQRVYNDLIQ